jgi:anti-sigma-K factor RskA
MSLQMTHDEVRAALAAEALDALDASEHDAVAAHLEGCADCRAELEAYHEASGALAYAAPRAALDATQSAAVRARLLQRATGDRSARAASRPSAARPAAPPPAEEPRVIPMSRPAPRPSRVGWLAAAAAMVLAVGAGVYAMDLRDELEGLRGQLALAEQKARDALAEVSERDEVIGGMTGRGVRVIDLASTQQREPSGRMFWDPATDRWTFFAYNLPQVREGREYELWLITPQGPVAAGTFRPEQGGRATVHARYDLPPDQLRAVAVTEEPAGGVPQPTGQILILGNAATE